jgi:hypothetical protein
MPCDSSFLQRSLYNIHCAIQIPLDWTGLDWVGFDWIGLDLMLTGLVVHAVWLMPLNVVVSCQVVRGISIVESLLPSHLHAHDSIK